MKLCNQDVFYSTENMWGNDDMDVDKELSPRQIEIMRICAILGRLVGSAILIIIICAISGVFTSEQEDHREVKPTGNQQASLNNTNKNININAVNVGVFQRANT